MKTSHKKTIFSGILFWIIMLTLSYLFNEIITGEAHKQITFFRPDTMGKFVLLGFTCMVWGILNAYGYRLFSSRINIKNRTLKGLVFGLVIFFIYIFLQETVIYEFINFPISIAVAGILHYFFSFTLGYIVIAQFHRS